MNVVRNIVIMAALAGIALGIVNSCGPSSPPPSAETGNRATDKGLTPPWPPATEQEAAISKDLMAKNYYVVLDGSGSMQAKDCSGDQNKMEAAKAALAVFAESVPADANLGLQVFDKGGVRERLPLGTGNREQFIGVVNSVRATGNTPLSDSVTQAYGMLLNQGKKQLGYGEYHLVIVTDGEADSGQNPTAVVNRLLKESPVVLHTIGFCIGSDHSLNQAGRTIYKAADNPDALRQGLADVLAEAPTYTPAKFK